MREFIEELKHNQEINIKNDYENRINIDYVIERLEDIQKEMSESIEKLRENLNSKGEKENGKEICCKSNDKGQHGD